MFDPMVEKQMERMEKQLETVFRDLGYLQLGILIFRVFWDPFGCSPI